LPYVESQIFSLEEKLSHNKKNSTAHKNIKHIYLNLAVIEKK